MFILCSVFSECTQRQTSSGVSDDTGQSVQVQGQVIINTSQSWSRSEQVEIYVNQFTHHHHHPSPHPPPTLTVLFFCSRCRATRGHRRGCIGRGAIARSRARAARAESAKETTRRCRLGVGASYAVMEHDGVGAVSITVPKDFSIVTGQCQLQWCPLQCYFIDINAPRRKKKHQPQIAQRRLSTTICTTQPKFTVGKS